MIPLLLDLAAPVTFDLTQALPPVFAFARASNAWAFDATPTLVQASANVPRFARDPATLAPLGLLVEPTRSNQAPNPRAEGASAGTPGTPPTGWIVSAGLGLASSIVGTGTESGIPYVDVRFFGTTTGTVNVSVAFQGTTTIAAASGQAWTGTAFLRLVAGAFGAFSQAPQYVIQEYNAGGTFLAQQTQLLAPAPSNAALATQRQAFTATLANASTAFAGLHFLVQYNTGTVVDFTLRIGVPQMEQGAFATSPIMPPPGSPAASTRAVDDLTLPLDTLAFWQTPAGFGAVLEFASAAPPAQMNGFVIWGVAPSSGFNDSWYAVVNASSVMSLAKINGGAGATSPTSNLLAQGVVQRLAISGQPGTFSGSLNGGAVMTASNAGYPTMLRQGLLRSPWPGPVSLPGYARRLRLYPRPLSNEQLQRESA